MARQPPAAGRPHASSRGRGYKRAPDDHEEALVEGELGAYRDKLPLDPARLIDLLHHPQLVLEKATRWLGGPAPVACERSRRCARNRYACAGDGAAALARPAASARGGGSRRSRDPRLTELSAGADQGRAVETGSDKKKKTPGMPPCGAQRGSEGAKNLSTLPRGQAPRVAGTRLAHQARQAGFDPRPH